MPLSEHEQRQLEQIEQALYRENRRLGRLVRSSDPRVHYRRRVVQAAFGFAIGAGMVAAGVVLPLVGLAVGGFIVLLLCWHLGAEQLAAPGRPSRLAYPGAGRRASAERAVRAAAGEAAAR